MQNKKSHFNIFLILSFGLFGLTALIFQVVFAKNLVLLFGLTAPAIATVLAVYFSGLALGSLIFGKLADKFPKLLHRLYIFCFVLTGIYCLFTPLLFRALGGLIQVVNRIYPLGFSGFNFFAFLFAFLFLIFPAILIGAGFPLISKILIKQSEVLGKKISLLYFVNTLGSVLGAFLAGFWLISTLGNNITIIFASVLNLVVAGLLFVLFAKHQTDTKQEHETDTKLSETLRVGVRQSASTTFKNPIFLYVLFVTGFLALALEVLYTKTLILFIGSSTYAFSLILVTFLLGIALGGLAASFFIDSIRRTYAFFGTLLAVVGFWLFLTLKFFQGLPFLYLKIFQSYQSFDFSVVLSAQFILTMLVIFPAAFLMGVIFPFAVRLANPALGKLGQGIGKLYFANTIGGVLGSLLSGFLLLPILGYQKTLLFILATYLVLAGLFILKEKSLHVVIKGALLSLLILGVGLSIISPAWSKGILSLGVFPYAKSYLKIDSEGILKSLATDKFLFYKEGISQVAVIKRGSNLLLRVNGKTDASSDRADLSHQIPSGALPLMLHPNPREVLVIGLGSGISLGSVTQFDEPEIIDMVEIDSAIIEAAGYFKKHNHNALDDSRVEMVLADGRNYLYLTDKKYDVISSQPSNLWVSGNAYLFTKEYYELAKSHLKENGLMAQWIQIYSFKPDDLKTVIRTFQEIFPDTYLFEDVHGTNLFLIGSTSKEPLLQFSEIEKKFENEKVKDELMRLYITNPYEFLAYFVSAGENLQEFTRNAEIHTSDRPFLEFSSLKVLYQNTVPDTVEHIRRLRADINPADFIIGGDRDELERHFEFYQKLIPVKIAFANSDLASAIDYYREAKKIGLEQWFVEADLIRWCDRVSKSANRQAGYQAERQVWDKCAEAFIDK